MSCPPSTSRAATTLAAMREKVECLERYMAGYEMLTGIAPTAWPVVELLTRVLNTGTGVYTLTFPSEPNDRFQIRASHTGDSWYILDNVVTAAASPNVITTWESPVYNDADLTIYFMIVRRHHLVTSCNGSPMSWPVADPCGPTSEPLGGLI